MQFFAPLTDQLNSYLEESIRLLPQLLLATFVLLFAWGIAFVVRRSVVALLSSSNMRPALVQVIKLLCTMAVWGVAILLSITIAFPSVTPAKMLGAVGLGGVAIGLAFRETLENFMAGIMIMVRKPMRIGDMIEVDDVVYGRIEQITMRDTYVRKLSNELILVPNSKIYKNPVEVITDRDERRHEIVVGVAYGEDAAAAREVIAKAVRDVAGLSRNREPEVYAREFNASSIDYTVRWWAGSQPVDMHKSRSDVVLAIKQALDDADIEIPFPYRTLTFKGAVPVAMGDASNEATETKVEAGAGKDAD
ncbi:MAG: mechanosensitive ion channel family protein [Pseudomonadota bacterium]